MRLPQDGVEEDDVDYEGMVSRGMVNSTQR